MFCRGVENREGQVEIRSADMDRGVQTANDTGNHTNKNNKEWWCFVGGPTTLNLLLIVLICTVSRSLAFSLDFSLNLFHLWGQRYSLLTSRMRRFAIFV